MARFGDLDTQYFDDAGDPLVNGKIYFYESGTTTLKGTFADVNQSIPNTNPVILTAAGRQPNIFFDGVAKAVLTTSSGTQILVRDPVGETATDFGDEWVATKIYSANDVVLGSDGVYYRSLVNGNQNNNPVTSTGSWTLLYSVEWNAGITYQEGAVVTYDGEQYQSLQGSNLNQNPSSASSYWVLLSFAWLSTATYSEDQNAVGTDGILYTSLQDSNTGNDPATSPAYWVGTSAAAAASATAAAASATASASSATDSANSATASANSATASANSATASASSATDSANSATASASSATDSANSATESAASASAAATSETNAATSETNAATSASNSATSATESAASATAALASETAAAASETAAAASESAAATSATNSATSATESANSATASASSATDSANSATASAGSATSSAGSATAAAGSATAAAGSATAAAGSATDAANTYDEFDDRYLGEKASDPTTDNDGDPLITGALYFNNVSDVMKVYTGSAWTNVAPTATSVTLSQISDLDSNLDSFLKQDGTSAEVISFDSNQFFAGTFSDKVVAIGSTGTAQTINCNTGTVYTATLTGNCTFTLATPNSDSNRATSFTLVLTNDGTASRTVAFAGGTFKYPGGSVSRTEDADATDIWFFFSPDNGTTWYVTLPAKNLT